MTAAIWLQYIPMYVCIHSIQKNVVSTQQGYSEFGSFKTRHDASLENCTVGHFGAKSAKYTLGFLIVLIL